MNSAATKHEFRGKWITTEEFCNLKPVDVFHRQLKEKEIKSFAPKNSHILFRSTFNLNKTSDVWIYISADDYYKLYINGKFVCQGPSAGYPFHYYYNKADISEFVKEGENTIAVHTYYQGLINRVWVSGDDRHGMICDITQGEGVILSSGEEFLCSYHEGFSEIGIFGYDTQFAQRYTSGTKSEAFEWCDYDDSNWKNASIRKHIDYELYEQSTKMLEFEKIMPKEVWDENGVTLDFGATYVGYLCAEAEGENGQSVELLFAQELCEDESLRWKLRANCEYREEWVLSGGKDHLNEYDYKSFRYVRLNIPKGCTVKNIVLVARHYPFELKARPAVTDKQLLSVWNLCVNTLKYGVQEVIQDCMDREKGNYLGDGCYTALAHAILTEDVSQIKKLVDDSLRSSFIDSGLVTCAACSFMQEIAEYPLMMYYLLYSYYRLTGDTEYLAEKYDALYAVLDCYRRRYMNDDGLLANLDKWCVVEWPEPYRGGYEADIEQGKICTDVHNVINAHYVGAVKYMNKICKLLGKAEFDNEEKLTQNYIRAFYDEKRRLFKDNIKSEHISVISNAFALMYSLLPNKETEENIIEFIKKKGFTSVMLFGAYPILEGLKQSGRKELMYEFLADENAWLRMISEGATTTFEGWGKEAKWNTSLFHLTLSYAVVFLTDWEKFGE